MPTILVNCGMEALFLANEMNEPIHVHAGKGEMECKFWQDTYNFEITISVEYNLTPQTRREIKKKIVYSHFDYIVDEWNRYFRQDGKSI